MSAKRNHPVDILRRTQAVAEDVAQAQQRKQTKPRGAETIESQLFAEWLAGRLDLHAWSTLNRTTARELLGLSVRESHTLPFRPPLPARPEPSEYRPTNYGTR